MNLIDEFNKSLKVYKVGMYDKLICQRAVMYSDNQVLAFLVCQDICKLNIVTYTTIDFFQGIFTFVTYEKDRLGFYFDPSPYTDDELIQRVKNLLVFI